MLRHGQREASDRPEENDSEVGDVPAGCPGALPDKEAFAEDGDIDG